jgi:hypothetical protein
MQRTEKQELRQQNFNLWLDCLLFTPFAKENATQVWHFLMFKGLLYEAKASEWAVSMGISA